MTVLVLCTWTGEWLPATLNTNARALWWQEGPVSDNVPVRIVHGAGEGATADWFATRLRGWGYRDVTVMREDDGGA